MYFHSESVQVFTVSGRRKDEKRWKLTSVASMPGQQMERRMETECKRQSKIKHRGRKRPVMSQVVFLLTEYKKENI